MKKTFRLLLSTLLLVSISTPLLADTIRLKDGSVIRGQVIGFKDQQFTILIGGNARGRRGQTTFMSKTLSRSSSTQPPAIRRHRRRQRAQQSPNRGPRLQYNQPDNTVPDSRSTRHVRLRRSTPTFFTIKVGVRADNANNGWTNSGLVVRKGQRLRISASGRVSLGRGRFSTPGG
jgi:hypothetical protein